MRFPEHEKNGRRSALTTLMTKLKGMNGDKLASLKKGSVKPAEGSEAEELMESPSDEAAEGEGGFCPHCGKAR